MPLNRKQKTIALRNLGVPEEGTPPLSSARDATLMIERLLLKLMRESVAKLEASEAETRRFFSHFFDGTNPEDLDAFVTNFRRDPPTVVLGYARSTAEFPCIAIVMESESQTQEFLAQYTGQSIEGEAGEPADYVGALFEMTHSCYIYAEHPDVCAYLYQFVKAVVLSGVQELLSRNVQDIALSGGELAPDESYMPTNMFVRALRITSTAPATVPRLLTTDPARVKVTGLHTEDIVIDGARGGIHAEVEIP